MGSADDIEISSHYLENEKQIAINFSVPYFNAENRIHEETVCLILKDKTVFTFIILDFEKFLPEKQRQAYFEKFSGFKISGDSYLLLVIGFISDYFADLTEIVSNTDLSVINEYIQNNFERLDDLRENISSKIDLEQNRIFKTLTIITVCISLPMLVAGIYGMNFKYMPELGWKWGYLYVVSLLILSFSLPLIWFKRKKWF